MNNERINPLNGILVILLLGSILFSFFEIDSLKSDLKNKDTEYNNLIEDHREREKELVEKYNSRDSELMEKYDNLETNYNNLEKDYNNLHNNYNSVQNGYDNLQKDYKSLLDKYNKLLKNPLSPILEPIFGTK